VSLDPVIFGKSEVILPFVIHWKIKIPGLRLAAEKLRETPSPGQETEITNGSLTQAGKRSSNKADGILK
jgi:hypothetical protein